MSTGLIAALRLVAPSTGATEPPFKVDRLALFGTLASLADRPAFTYDGLPLCDASRRDGGLRDYRRLRSGRGRQVGACRVA
jgi:hypothetical protein